MLHGSQRVIGDGCCVVVSSSDGCCVVVNRVVAMPVFGPPGFQREPLEYMGSPPEIWCPTISLPECNTKARSPPRPLGGPSSGHRQAPLPQKQFDCMFGLVSSCKPLQPPPLPQRITAAEFPVLTRRAVIRSQVVGVVLRWLVCRYQSIRLYEAGFQATSECTDMAELFLLRDTHTVRPQSPRDTRCVHNRLLKLSLPHWAYAKWTTSKPGVRLRIALMASHLLP